MELEEEAAHLMHVLTPVSYEDILLQLIRHHDATRTVRCCLTVNYFAERILNTDKYKNDGEYKLALNDDLVHLKWFFPDVSINKLQFFLETIGPIPNNRLIVAKLLMGPPPSERKRRYIENSIENPEVSSTKINKTEIDEPNTENVLPISPKTVASLTEEPESAINTPKNIIDTIEINESPIIVNETPVKQKMHDFIEILDSPVTNDLGPGPSHASTLPVCVQNSPPINQPGPSRTLNVPNMDYLNRRLGPPVYCLDRSLHHQPGQSNVPIHPRYCPGNPLQLRQGLPTPSIPQVFGFDNSLPGPSNVTRPHRVLGQDNPLNGGAGLSRPADSSLLRQVEPLDISPLAWRPIVDFDQSDDDDGDSIIYPENLGAEKVAEQAGSTAPFESVKILDDKTDMTVDEKLVLKLMEVFPDVSPDFLRNICAGKKWSEATFEQLMDTILTADGVPTRPERPVSPEKEIDPQEQLAMLKSLFPDADPTYLERKVEELTGNQAAMAAFIENAMDKKVYPTMKEYLRQQQLSAQHKQYTSEFKVEKFVELFPNPVGFFENPKRETNLGPYDKYYIRWFLRKKYSQLYVKDINYAVDCPENTNVFSMVNYLEKRLRDGIIKSVRTTTTISRPDVTNIPLLQELAYFEHKEEILKYLEDVKDQAAKDRQEAKKMSLMQMCSCCFDDEVMPLDILTCTGGCRFCRDCIKRSTEVAFGDGKINFPCLSSGCDAEFGLQILQNVLDPKLFSKIAQKKAVAEVKAAGLEDLESCPFCDFANIPAPEDKVFRCLNPDCMKESCRSCKEPSHLPLRCDEVEKDEAVKARTFIENKMAEALIRECWKCGAKFIKEEGCNKMTCSCGAMMCYVCRQPVKNYKHFNGQGGDQFDLCPLYSDNVLNNEKNVLEAAIEAKKQVDPAQLKTDPTVNVQNYADKIKQAEKKVESQQQQQRVARVYIRRQDIVHNRIFNYNRLVAAIPHGPVEAAVLGFDNQGDPRLVHPAPTRHRQAFRHYRGPRNNNQ